MPIDDKTAIFGLPKPHPTNRASEDVLRLRAALDAVDMQLDKQAKDVRLTEFGGVRVARNLAVNVFVGYVNGVVQLVTPIKRLSNTMFRFDIRGYDYGESRLVDHLVCGYSYGSSKGADGLLGLVLNTSAVRRGNTAKNRIFMGFDAAGNLNILFGAPQASNYLLALAVDGQFHHGVSSVNPADYRLIMNNDPAPAAGATSGFGLTCLVEV